MKLRAGASILCLAGICLSTLVTGAFAQQARPEAEGQEALLAAKRDGLAKSLEALRSRKVAGVADAAIFEKGIDWALRYDGHFSPADIAQLERAASRCGERMDSLIAGVQPWTARRGHVALGYVSQIDGSVQPYGLVIPKTYDPQRSWRLDVVLHGSSKPVGMSELKFISRFDRGDGESAEAPDVSYFELHPLGRVENAYRWAGETDVFEAIDDVCRRYAIDRDRIVLRGMSMGASGTWHLGLKHPDRFVALGPYCGYVDTHRFSETPLAHFVRVGPLPEHQELGLHMLDSIDYAANARKVPVIACIGEQDVFFQGHVHMGEAMRREGLTLVNLISPGTGHVIDPMTQAEQLRRIAELAGPGVDRCPREVRFVTWTLKYSRCHWLEVLGLEKHYARAELAARLRSDAVEIDEPVNITRFAILTGQLDKLPKTVRIGSAELALPPAITAKSPGIVIAKATSGWEIAGAVGDAPLAGKRPGLQGPIDDAFTSAFVCVRGTGQAWNPAAQAYASAALARFTDEWRHYFRGELPVCDDTAVTQCDAQTKNLILFGDPGSNLWIAKALPKLPLAWSREKLQLGGRAYDSSEHVPALIAPNPLPGCENHYLVLNSGHTFRETELSTLNYLLFPRWGDWAVLQIPAARDKDAPLVDTVLQAGYFDEAWRDPANLRP